MRDAEHFKALATAAGSWRASTASQLVGVKPGTPTAELIHRKVKTLDRLEKVFHACAENDSSVDQAIRYLVDTLGPL